MSDYRGKGNVQVRMPCAIGFYPGQRSALLNLIEECYTSKHGPSALPKVNEHGKRKIVGGIAPHAGYIYSGPIAAALYYRLALDGIPQTFVLVGPVHGYGSGVGVMRRGAWRTPLGDVKIDEEFSDALLEQANIISDDPSVHEDEHSLEVQLPFLQSLFGERLRIVPVATSVGDPEICGELGKAISRTAVETGRDIVVVASTDMTHYGAHYGYAPAGTSPIEKVLRWVNEIDGKAIKTIQTLDETRFLRLVSQERMTMCGYAPVATLMATAKASGVSKAELLKYATSYDTQGSKDAIVGYCSMIFEK